MNEANTRTFMQNEARQTKGASVGIPPRMMQFNVPDGTAKYPFFDGNQLGCSFFCVLSGIFPPGERFFVESVRHYRKEVKGEKLKAQVSGFIGQEAIHGKEHEHLNEWFQAQGYDVAMADRMIRFSLGLLEKLPPAQQIACTTLMEHFTAHLAEQWLTNKVFRNSTDPEMIKLWSWHALEELEHKAVVFDVHEQISKNPHLERLLAVPLVAGALLPGIFFSWAWITLRHKDKQSLKAHRHGFKILFGRGGFMRRVLAPMPTYFAKDFHPDQHDTAELEKHTRELFFGKQGTLKQHWKNKPAVA